MTIVERFMAKIAKQPDGCWLWTAAIIKAVGYGRFGMSTKDVDYAHRASWRLFRGAIPNGVFVCHTCDVRACVNPDHLFLGTHHDNMRDAASKGRIRTPAASFASDETHQVAKLKNADVLAIRASGAGLKELSMRFGVSTSTIHRARSGFSFRGVACR